MGTIIPDFFLKLTAFAVSLWPLLLVAFIFWVVDRKTGRMLLGAFSLAMLFNGFLKALFCVYRPWVRDARINPYGDAKVTATGYSFPSGHTLYITPTVGGVGVWQWKRHRFISILCFIFVALVMFSRNFLGCHTLQDVVAGAIVGFLCIFLSGKIESWIDGKAGRDKTALIIAIILSVVLVFFYLFKPYPMDYDSAGKLISDPKKLMRDCFEGIGTIIAFYAARILEKKGFDFDKEMHWKDRFIVGVFASIPLFFWRISLCPLIIGLNPYIGNFLEYSVEIFYIVAVVPWIMGLIHKSGILNREKLG